MQLRESIRNTKIFFLNFKSLLFHGYQNLPRPHFNPFSCATSNSKQLADHEYYNNFCNELECDLDMVLRLNSNNTIMLPPQSTSHPSSPLKMEGGKEEKKSSHCEIYGLEQEQGSVNRKKKKKKTKKKSSNEDSFLLARKMKELEMMDVSDMEHVLDVEEAIHYYSRLKSPVYLDIVDKFFTDIYHDFSIPHDQTSSITINSSKRRLGSFRL
ncbi:hypothetical protein LINPERPRIM_LOCUS30462 [Linum perenne]